MKAVTEYRPAALAPADFAKLQAKASEALSFRPRPRVVMKRDEYGDMKEVRDDFGEEVFPKGGEIDPRLVESLTRPTTPRYTVIHLTRLAGHLPFGRGAASFGQVVEDIARDLEGVSEFAIVRACEHFRADESLKFFPPTAAILRYVRDLDYSLKNLKTKKPKTAATPAPEAPVKTTKDKVRVARIVKIGLKAEARRTPWERKFFNAVLTKGKKP